MCGIADALPHDKDLCGGIAFRLCIRCREKAREKGPQCLQYLRGLGGVLVYALAQNRDHKVEVFPSHMVPPASCIAGEFRQQSKSFRGLHSLKLGVLLGA